ncbi:MAG: hypothetical protein SFT90_00645 [Rickettsiales bacterium]|nr:hypothetical protein [Rickettsiales bacterium]
MGSDTQLESGGIRISFQTITNARSANSKDSLTAEQRISFNKNVISRVAGAFFNRTHCKVIALNLAKTFNSSESEDLTEKSMLEVVDSKLNIGHIKIGDSGKIYNITDEDKKMIREFFTKQFNFALETSKISR